MSKVNGEQPLTVLFSSTLTVVTGQSERERRRSY